MNRDGPHRAEYTTINVQRPVFHALPSSIKAELPKSGEVMLKRLSKTEVVVVRRLK